MRRRLTAALVLALLVVPVWGGHALARVAHRPTLHCPKGERLVETTAKVHGRRITRRRCVGYTQRCRTKIVRRPHHRPRRETVCTTVRRVTTLGTGGGTGSGGSGSGGSGSGGSGSGGSGSGGSGSGGSGSGTSSGGGGGSGSGGTKSHGGTTTTGTGTTKTTTTPPATGQSPDPSGTPIPTGNPPGWIEDFADDFTASSLAADTLWTPYGGAPAGRAAEGFWDPSHDVLANGQLELRGYRDPSVTGAPAGAYVTGGVETTSFSQTYGKYLVRFRMDQGQGVAYSVLLWPIANGSHAEVDFAEDNGAAPRAWSTATVHYGAANNTIVNALEVDVTQWHTLGVEWSPGSIVYTIDGRPWATVEDPNVPAAPMRLDLQTQSWACGSDAWEQCPNASTPAEVDMDVDWVVAYRPAS